MKRHTFHHIAHQQDKQNKSVSKRTRCAPTGTQLDLFEEPIGYVCLTDFDCVGRFHAITEKEPAARPWAHSWIFLFGRACRKKRSSCAGVGPGICLGLGLVFGLGLSLGLVLGLGVGVRLGMGFGFGVGLVLGLVFGSLGICVWD